MMDDGLKLLFNANHISALLMVVARFFGAISMFAVLQDNMFSKMLKILLSTAFALIIVPALPVGDLSRAPYYLQIFYIFKEYFVGYILGYIMSIPIWVIQGIGQYIDNQRGESMGALLNPMSGTPSSSSGSLLIQSFTVYFISMNGLIFFVSILYKSFTLYPLDDFFPIVDAHMLDRYIDLFKSFMSWIILIAMPVIIMMFIIEVVLGLVSTFLPQMNVTVISMPIKSCVGLFVLILYMNHMYQFILMHFLNEIKGVYV
jgi:type III secretion protein T